jgi:ubiquinone/menaquinone biosynthesis C-methylase UbiE
LSNSPGISGSIPSEILGALNLKSGDTVADLGAGAGYFTLKLSPLVGKSGTVLAVDGRAFPSLFVWIRALRRGQDNVKLIQGEPENPRLPDRANAVLVVNTYHEFTSRRKILNQVSRCLVPGSRLVIVDRGPPVSGQGSAATEDHELPLASAERDVSQAGFEVLQRNDDFVRPPGDSTWWMIVARKRGM